MSWLEKTLAQKPEHDLYDAFLQLYTLRGMVFNQTTLTSSVSTAKNVETNLYIYRKKFIIIPIKINGGWKFFQTIVETQHWILNDVVSSDRPFFAGMKLFECMEDLMIKRLKEGCLVKEWKRIT